MDVSFGSPIALLGLLAVPVLVLWYVATSRRRRRIADAFRAPPLAPSVTPNSPGFRRHVPALMLIAAIAFLLTAMARPQRTVSEAVERAQIMLVTDVSGSMLADDVAPSRLKAAQSASRKFLGQVPDEVNVGIMVFNQTPRVLQSPTTDREAAKTAIGQYQASGGTATGDAINGALRALGKTTGTTTGGKKGPPSAIVLLSDGVSTKGSDPVEAAQAAKKAGVSISTVALGTPEGTISVPRPRGAAGFETRKVPPDPETMKQIAQITGGTFTDAKTSADLSGVYKQLGSQLGRRDVKREMTAGLAGLAGLLALCACALSLKWFGRLA